MEEDSMKILCVGHAAYDITIPVETFPIENTKNRVHQKIECGGGPANTAAYLLGSWGMDVTFAGIVGDDTYGHHIIQELQDVHVNIDYIEISKDYQTTSGFILVNQENGSRTVFNYHPSNMKMKELQLNFEPDIILLDGQEYDISIKLLEKYPHAICILDAGRDRREIIELAKKVDYIVCLKEFAEKVTGIKIDYQNTKTLENIYKRMKTMFKGIIVITLESHGCLYEYQEQIKIMPSIQVKALDSTGAGDIFHGAFTYGIAKKYDFETVLKLSNIAGAISVTRIGGRNSIPTKEEMECVYEQFK